MTGDIRSFLRRYALMIYGPSALFTIGQGAVIPIIPLIAIELGANLATAALVAGSITIGQLLGNLPAGWIVSRAGERITMIVSGSVAFLGVVGMWFAPNLLLFTLAVFLVGVCGASFNIARHAFMTKHVPIAFRARSLSMLGGVYRFGIFLGPFVGALLIGLFTDNRIVCLWFAFCSAGAVLLVWLGPDPERVIDNQSTTTPVATVAPRIGVFKTIAQHHEVLTRVGLAAASMSAVRAARYVVLPLWGEAINLQSSQILIVVGISGAIDFALFYVSGKIMDRYGRLWAALPSMLIMGLSFLMLSLTLNLEQAPLWYLISAIGVGLGNGFSAGILMTLGADLAPQKQPAAFLGAWNTLTDGGSASTSIIFSSIVAVSSISFATAFLGVLAFAGSWGFLRWVPRYVSKR